MDYQQSYKRRKFYHLQNYGYTWERYAKYGIPVMETQILYELLKIVKSIEAEIGWQLAGYRRREKWELLFNGYMITTVQHA